MGKINPVAMALGFGGLIAALYSNAPSSAPHAASPSAAYDTVMRDIENDRKYENVWHEVEAQRLSDLNYYCNEPAHKAREEILRDHPGQYDERAAAVDKYYGAECSVRHGWGNTEGKGMMRRYTAVMQEKIRPLWTGDNGWLNAKFAAEAKQYADQ